MISYSLQEILSAAKDDGSGCCHPECMGRSPERSEGEGSVARAPPANLTHAALLTCGYGSKRISPTCPVPIFWVTCILKRSG